MPPVLFDRAAERVLHLAADAFSGSGRAASARARPSAGGRRNGSPARDRNADRERRCNRAAAARSCRPSGRDDGRACRGSRRRRRRLRELPLDVHAVLKRVRDLHVGREPRDVRRNARQRHAAGERIGIRRIENRERAKRRAVVQHQVGDRTDAGAVVEEARSAAHDRLAVLARRPRQRRARREIVANRERTPASRSAGRSKPAGSARGGSGPARTRRTRATRATRVRSPAARCRRTDDRRRSRPAWRS